MFAGENGFPGAKRELAAAFAGEETRFEHRLVRRGTGRRSLEAFYRPHRSAEGHVLGVVTLLTDITERKALEIRLAQQTRDLKRSNEELEQFAYVASHDLKAPLRGIENLVTWIEEDLEGSLTGDVQTNMGLLKSRVKRLESLLDDLLAYSRAGRGDLVLDTVNTGSLVAELAALVSPPAGFVIEGVAGTAHLARPTRAAHPGVAEPDRQCRQASRVADRRTRRRGGKTGRADDRVQRHRRWTGHSRAVPGSRVRHVPNAEAARRG